jgi:hypothetical protein
VEEERHRAAHGLAEQEPAAAAAVGADGLGDEEGVAVADERVEVGDVALEPVGAAVALVVEAEDGEPGARQPLAGSAHRHGALHGVPVAEEDERLWWAAPGLGHPRAGEEPHPARVPHVLLHIRLSTALTLTLLIVMHA